jgi:AcrR family transcriptional regulator
MVRRVETEDPRGRLLAAAVDHVTGHGVGDWSLRGIAAAIGTSHRMLIYHFGSKEGLLVEVVRTVEERQREALAELRRDLDADPPADPADLARRFWRRLADPALWPAERLFYELYGQALAGRVGTVRFLDGIVESWLDPLAELVRRTGVPPERVRATARLGVAVARGLLLDLLATGDREGVDEAMERFIEIHPLTGTPPTGPAGSGPPQAM